MSSHECTDACIVEDEPWDCSCYSHNTPPDPHHEKNPQYRGLTHAQVLERAHGGKWCVSEIKLTET